MASCSWSTTYFCSGMSPQLRSPWVGPGTVSSYHSFHLWLNFSPAPPPSPLSSPPALLLPPFPLHLTLALSSSLKALSEHIPTQAVFCATNKFILLEDVLEPLDSSCGCPSVKGGTAGAFFYIFLTLYLAQSKLFGGTAEGTRGANSQTTCVSESCLVI